MKMVMQVGGTSNAFTSYDQTCYWQTLPASNTEMALYLEADRMASFKVSDPIFQTERKVVSEEWRLRYANQPYGPMFADFVKAAYKNHSYRWTTIGDMDQLKAATSSELQDFFNKYYVPNNACLVISGDIDVDQTKQWVKKYFGWIPKGADVTRDIQPEPEQAETRRSEVFKQVPLATLMMGYKTTNYTDDDHYALGLLGEILGGGPTSRLEKLLVNSANPICNQAGAGDQPLEDQSLFAVRASMLPGHDIAEAEKIIADAIGDVVNNGVTQEELDRAKVQARQGIVRGRETAQNIAEQLSNESVFGRDATRVNQEWEKIRNLTPADLQEVAKKYLQPARLTVLRYMPDPTGLKSRLASKDAAAKATEGANAAVVPSNKPIQTRDIKFPEGYLTRPPLNESTVKKQFEKGVESVASNGTKVIVMSDHRLPLVNWSLVMRSGGDAEPKGKEGLAQLTASMLRRGAGDLYYLELSEDLASRGINIGAADASDNTMLSGTCPTEQLDHAIGRAREMLLQPKLPEPEFNKLKRQSMAGLMRALSSPPTVADRELRKDVWGEDSPQGRMSTLESLKSITLDDLKDWYQKIYKPNNALLVISGDISPEKGKEIAEKLLSGWQASGDLPKAEYTELKTPEKRKIVLVDNPEGKQSTIRMAIPAFDINSEDKFPGSAAGRILSDGIHARLDRYVRAEKGYTYGAFGQFDPSRHGGIFAANVDTNPDTTADCIEAMFKVFNDMRKENVTPEELAEAKTRVAGVMLMQMQTIGQQAQRRLDAILNGYPIDYWDSYTDKINTVSAEQIREVMDKYVQPDRMTVVVVAPASQVKQQLERLGEVQVVPMPVEPSRMNRMNELMRPTGP
jgi:zinc protease